MTWLRSRLATVCTGCRQSDGGPTMIAAGDPIYQTERSGLRFCPRCAQRILAIEPPADLPPLPPESAAPTARAVRHRLPFDAKHAQTGEAE